MFSEEGFDLFQLITNTSKNDIVCRYRKSYFKRSRDRDNTVCWILDGCRGVVRRFS